MDSQFTDLTFKRLHDQFKNKHSDSRKGTPYDNILIEAFLTILKKEEINRNVYAKYEEEKHALSRYIADFYNSNRIHKQLRVLNN